MGSIIINYTWWTGLRCYGKYVAMWGNVRYSTSNFLLIGVFNLFVFSKCLDIVTIAKREAQIYSPTKWVCRSHAVRFIVGTYERPQRIEMESTINKHNRLHWQPHRIRILFMCFCSWSFRLPYAEQLFESAIIYWFCCEFSHVWQWTSKSNTCDLYQSMCVCVVTKPNLK